VFTTDFRRVYSTMIETWLGQPSRPDLLHGTFEPFDMIA